MPRDLYCNVVGSSPNVQNLVSKIFAKYCKRLVSKVSCVVSVSERSCLGLVLSFCSKSRSRLGLATSMSRLGIGLEAFGRDSSSGSIIAPSIVSHNLITKTSYHHPYYMILMGYLTASRIYISKKKQTIPNSY